MSLRPFSAVARALLAASVNYSDSPVKSQIALHQREIQEKLKEQELARDEIMTERREEAGRGPYVSRV